MTHHIEPTDYDSTPDEYADFSNADFIDHVDKVLDESDLVISLWGAYTDPER